MHDMTEDRPGAAFHTITLLVRAVVVAGILGTVLTLLNQWPAVTGKAPIQWFPLVLAYLTPFIVVALSQVLGIRAARQATAWISAHRENFGTTLASHGIPRRALALGLVIGGINAAIVTAGGTLAGQDLAQLPVAPMLQALILPMLFGALSQTITFRQAMQVERTTNGRGQVNRA